MDEEDIRPYKFEWTVLGYPIIGGWFPHLSFDSVSFTTEEATIYTFKAYWLLEGFIFIYHVKEH
jgi:hypothetical protein